MELFSAVLRAFFCGGILCLIGQILIDKTALTPAKILTSYVVAGVLLGAAGLYAPIQEWGGAGAAVPLTGFGANLAKGVREAVVEQGVLPYFTISGKVFYRTKDVHEFIRTRFADVEERAAKRKEKEARKEERRRKRGLFP